MNGSGLSLIEKKQIAQLEAVIQQLRSQGNIVMQESAGAIPDGDVEAFQQLGVDQNKLLLEAAQDAKQVLVIVTRHQDLLEQGYQNALASPNLTNEQKAKAQELVQRAGNVSSYAKNGLNGIVQAGGAQVISHLQNLQKQQDIPIADIKPRLSNEFWCNCAAGMFIGGAFTGDPFAMAFGLGLAIGIGC